MRTNEGQPPNDLARLLGVLLGLAMVGTIIAWTVLALVVW